MKIVSSNKGRVGGNIHLGFTREKKDTNGKTTHLGSIVENTSQK